MKKTLDLVWISLILLSLFAYLLGQIEDISKQFIALLLLSTFLKGQLIIDYFMSLKEVKLGYRLIPTLWLGIVISLIAFSYYTSP